MNKVIVVSGGSKGIGKEIIKKFAAQGFNIATCARNESDLAQLKKEVESQYSVNLYYQVADLSQKKDTLAFAELVKSLNQPIEVLINNTGVFMPGSIVEEEEGNLEKMIDTNLYSAYHLTRALIPSMIQAKKGHIFNICSIASIMAYPNGGSYSISKFALLGFSKVLREEMKPQGIRVTSVLPGATLTASWEGVEVAPERLMKAEDVADTVYATYALSQQAVVEEVIIRPQLGDL